MARVGISGWRYAPWRGVFYPAGLAQHRELAYAAERLGTIEINGTFYSLQRPSSFQAWASQTPDGFVFAVKGGRYLTHMLRLENVDTALANFFAQGLLALGEKLGPLLWQLPPDLPFDPDRLARFFDLLPRTTAGAAELAARHDQRLDGRAWTSTDADRPLRHALEVRHPSYETPAFVELLREHGIALVVADTAGRWPVMHDVTSDLVYVRLHGDKELYTSGYGDDALELWAARVRAWARGDGAVGDRLVAAPAADRPQGRDVLVYFDNDVKAHAPRDAMSLAARLGGQPDVPASPRNCP